MAQGYSVTISAVDQVSAPLANIGKELSQLSRNLKQFQKDSTAPTGSQEKAGFFERAKEFATKGSHEVGKGLREIGHEAREAGRKIGEAFEPIAKLGGLGTGAISGLGLLGVAEGLGRIAESGQNLLHTSQRIGVSTQAIQGLGNAAKIAGSSSEAMSAGLVSLQEKLTAAALGQDSEAIAFFKQFNVGVRNASDNSIRLADKVLPELADAIAAQKNPTVQAAMAVRAFGDAGILLLPILRQGHEGIERLRKEGEKLDASTGEWVHTADEYKISQDKVEVAVSGLGKTIATDLLPKMKPLTDGFAAWLGELQKSPAAVKAIEVGVGALAVAMGVTAVAAIAKLMEKMAAFNVAFAASPLGKVLGVVGFGLEFGDAAKSLQTSPDSFASPSLDKLYRERRGGGRDLNGNIIPFEDAGRGEYGVGQHRPNYNGVTVPIPGKQGAASGGYGGPMVTGDRAQNAQTIAATLKARGWSDAAIRGSLANGIIESGLAAWGRPGGAGERGIWQFNPGSHLPPYERFAAKAGKPVTDVGAQTNYMADWVERHMPDYKSIQNDRQATDEFMRRFEAPKNPEPGSRFGALGQIPNLEMPKGQSPAKATTTVPVHWLYDNSGPFRSTQREIATPGGYITRRPDAPERDQPITRGFLVPPGTKFSSRGQPYASDLGTMSPEEKARVEQSMQAIRAGQKSGKPWYAPTPAPVDATPPAPEATTRPRVRWLYDSSGPFRSPQTATQPQEDKRSDLDFLRNGDTGDSKTHVQVDFNNAPQGTRTRIASADGPARTSLRTQFAFGAI